MGGGEVGGREAGGGGEVVGRRQWEGNLQKTSWRIFFRTRS